MTWDVKDELLQINKKLNYIQGAMQRMAIDIATLKVKSSVWGFMAGLLPAIAVAIYVLMK